MRNSVRVNLHCHSNHSDGSVSPDRIVASLSNAGVQYASLTDHDTTEGLVSFEQALGNHGIIPITGVEITVEGTDDNLHLLAYGFDPDNPELQQLLKTNRQRRAASHSPFHADLEKARGWIGKLRQQSREQLSETIPDVADVIRIVHRAGGTLFLAHPLTVTDDFSVLDQWLKELKDVGLDGIEAVYASYSADIRNKLHGLAIKHGLLISGGTDFHGYDIDGLNQVSIDMPLDIWEPFREAHRLPAPIQGLKTDASADRAAAGNYVRSPLSTRRKPGQKRRFAFRIVLPTLLATALFITTIFAIILPQLESNLLERQRDMIRELTYSAWSILAGYEEDARAGLISREEAQQRAIDRIEQLRYGREQKDYFWITDMQPRMIMHPYRTELNGTDLSDFRDVRGTALFVEFVDVAREQGEGYVDYYWQWKDDPDRIVPKDSFVKRFEPWDWVIGTGIYLDDVYRDINDWTGRLTKLSIGVTTIIILLLVWITWESLRIEIRRSRIEGKLHESHEKYAALVAATTEGTLMVLDGRCAYSNDTMAHMLGYSEQELSQLDFRRIFPATGQEPSQALQAIEGIMQGETAPDQMEAELVTKNGNTVNALLAVTRIAFAGKSGIILVARDVTLNRLLEEELGESREQFRTLTENLDIGVFRTTAGRDPVFIEMNAATRRMFRYPEKADPGNLHLLDLIPDRDERQQTAKTLESGEGLKNHIIAVQRNGDGEAYLSLSLVLIRDEHGIAKYFDGIVEDITRQKRSDEERETLLQEFQSSLLFLNEPLKNMIQPMLKCDMHTSVHRAVNMMSRQNAGALAVTSGDDFAVVGIVTDHDLRERVLAGGLDGNMPVFNIMSSPVLALPDTAPVYEAILTMQQNEVSHIAIRNAEGSIFSIVRNADLIQFHKYSSAVITNEIQRAQTIDEIVDARARLPRLVQTLLDCGARSRNINRIMTRMANAIVERLLDIAMEELGPPPCRYCFIALGSEGRAEQTLVTDQDNALIYEDVEGEKGEYAREYFLKLSELVCSWLNRVGYTYCRGDVMARNPKWCQPLSQWKLYFRDWITGSTPKDLLDFNIFFDFRPVDGDPELVQELKATIHSIIEDYPPFLLHFAQNALLYKPPIGFMGKLVVESGGDKPNTLNIKEAMLSIVNFARLYALKHHIDESNTLDRLTRLSELQVLTKSFHDEILQAYSFMMGQRLNHQAQAIAAGKTPDNSINPKSLNQLDETMLKQSFALISVLRKKISGDFLGSV